jgi:RNA polymerase sigma-70 factor (ECF subfamily)
VKIENYEANKIPDKDTVKNSQQEQLYHAINKLSDIDKAIITLYLDEFSYKEIADIIGITESNTGVKINRIKSQILKSFENGK